MSMNKIPVDFPVEGHILKYTDASSKYTSYL